MIHLENTAFGYHGIPIIHCVSLTITPGRCLGIYGANGSGKSTLLRGIAGALRPLSGTVSRGKSPGGNRPLTISLVPQRQGIDAAWPMTAADAAAMAPSALSFTGWLGSRKRQIHLSMERLGIPHLAPKTFAQLSGGQQQRVLLAGALACEPHILLLDEPAEGLDAASTASLLQLLRDEVHQGMALVMISHESRELSHVADDFAWVDVAATPNTPNKLVSLSREDFLDRAAGRELDAPVPAVPHPLI